MVFKINLGETGKTWKLELDSELLIGKKIGEKLQGKELKPELEGYELEITGTSDKAGFAGSKDLEGANLRRVLLTKGKFMKGYVKRRKKTIKVKGLRMKKTLRGNQISKDTIQINIKVIKQGSKKLQEIFPEQNKPKEEVKNPIEAKPVEENKDEVKKENEVKESS